MGTNTNALIHLTSLIRAIDCQRTWLVRPAGGGLNDKFPNAFVLTTCRLLVIRDSMINGQNKFGSCCLIEPFSAKAAMPGHPTHLDDLVKAIGVIGAEDVARSLVRVWISSEFFHPTLLSAPCQNVDRSSKKQILRSRRLRRFHGNPRA
jgi:hypothetical protein